MSHVVRPPLHPLPLGVQLEELKYPEARIDCKKYFFFPDCMGSRSKKRLAQENELGHEQEQEQRQALMLENGQEPGQEKGQALTEEKGQERGQEVGGEGNQGT